MDLDIVYNEDCLQGLKKLPSDCVDCCVTSPPYYSLRDYGMDAQIGKEETPQAYIDKLTDVFMEVYRVMKPEGTLWVNIGDSYATHASASSSYSHNFKSSDIAAKNGIGTMKKPSAKSMGMKEKDLIGIPWMLAFNLRANGWYLRQDIIWHKPNPMPDPIKDRCANSHEYMFLLSKSKSYFFDYEQIQEQSTTPDENGQLTGKRNKRDVWSVNTKPDLNAHFAVYPEELIRPCILAGCPKGGVVLDPFMGSGTTARCARRWGRHYVGFELNPEYIDIIRRKSNVEVDMFAE
jgi:DNA modification methylase